LRPGDRPRRGRRVEAARLVLLRERNRGRPRRRRVPAARGRRRVVGLPLVEGPRDVRAGRRRRVSRAVPARVPRQATARSGRRSIGRRAQDRAADPRNGRIDQGRKRVPDPAADGPLPGDDVHGRSGAVRDLDGRRRAPRGEPEARTLPLRGSRVSPAPAAALLAALTVAALLAAHTVSVAVIAAALLVVALRAPARRRWPYLLGALTAGASVFLVSPLVQTTGSHPLWTGPTVPVLGPLDVTREELGIALFQAVRLTALALAAAVYALLVDHDRLLASAGWARRSTLAVVLATRLVPTLDAH